MAEAISSSKSTLLDYFKRPTAFDDLLYVDYYREYIKLGPTDASGRGLIYNDLAGFRWKKRSYRHVVRMNMLTPRNGDVYYLRLILQHKPGRSFEELCTKEGALYDTFREAALAHGYCVDDNEAELCM